MGNAGTKKKEASIFVQTREPFYFPHGYVEGAVFIEAYQMLYASHIDLVLKGEEKVKWEELEEPSKQGESIKQKMKDHNKIFEPFQIPLHKFEGSLAPGQYQFPFAFQLPEGIPGTFHIKYGDYEGRIRYTIKAELSINHSDNLKYKTDIIVRQQHGMATYNSPVMVEDTVCMCCIPKGNTIIECNFQSDTYQPGEEAYVVCKANNQNCKVDIHFFVIRLVQKIVFRTRAGKETRFSRIVAKKDYDGIESGVNISSKPKLLSLILSEVQTDMMTSSLEKDKVQLQPNVHGRLVNCTYEMEIFPQYEVACGCCSKVPIVSLPLHIYARPLSNWISGPPPDFHPTTFEVQQLILPIMRIDAKMSISPNSNGIEPDFKMSVGPVVRAEVGIPSEYIDTRAPPVPIRVEREDPRAEINMNLEMKAPASQYLNEESKITSEIPVVKIEIKKDHAEKPSEEAKVELNVPAIPAEVKNEETTDSNIYTKSEIDVVPIESEIFLFPKKEAESAEEKHEQSIDEKDEQQQEEKHEEVVEEKHEEVVEEKHEEVLEEKHEEVVEEKHEEVVEEKHEEVVEEKHEEVVEEKHEEVAGEEPSLSHNINEEVNDKDQVPENKVEEPNENTEEITAELGEAMTGTE